MAILFLYLLMLSSVARPRIVLAVDVCYVIAGNQLQITISILRATRTSKHTLMHYLLCNEYMCLSMCSSIIILHMIGYCTEVP
jgi:hypothetical protein